MGAQGRWHFLRHFAVAIVFLGGLTILGISAGVALTARTSVVAVPAPRASIVPAPSPSTPVVTPRTTPVIARATHRPVPQLTSTPLLTPTPVPVASPAAVAPVADGFVRRDGTHLTLDGKPYTFLGYFENLMSQPGLRCGVAMTDADVVRDFDDLENVQKVNGLRVWFFNMYGGPGHWQRFDLIVHEADIHHIKLIVTLANQLGDCEPFLDSNDTLDVKHLDWYQKGYTEPHNGNPSGTGGYAISYRTYVRDVAARYANSPAILAWQLINEADPQPRPGQTLTGDECAHVLRTWADTMVDVIHSVDPNHLTSLGTYGAGGCGSYTSADYRYIHAGKIDLCEYHDYGYPTMPMPGTDPNANLQLRINDCAADGKPLFVGEAGIGYGSGGPTDRAAPTLQARADDFSAKITAAFAHGVAGYIVWQGAPDDPGFYDIPPGDPTATMIAARNYASHN